MLNTGNVILVVTVPVNEVGTLGALIGVLASCSSGGCHWMDCVVCLLSEENKQVSSIEQTIFAIKE